MGINFNQFIADKQRQERLEQTVKSLEREIAEIDKQRLSYNNKMLEKYHKPAEQDISKLTFTLTGLENRRVALESALKKLEEDNAKNISKEVQ